MSHRRLSQQQELIPSDSLLDVITNLVGVIIVVVVLVLIGTRRRQPERPKPKPTPKIVRAYLEEAASLGGEMAKLRRETEDFERQAQTIQQQIAQLRREKLGPIDDLPALQDALEKVEAQRKAAAARLQKLRKEHQKSAKVKPTRKTVTFRRPILRPALGKRKTRFTIMGTRIAHLDLDRIWQWAEDRADSLRGSSAKYGDDPSVTVHLPTGGLVESPLGRSVVQLSLSVDPGRGQELDPAVGAADLVDRIASKRGPPSAVVLHFHVWPDGFVYYRRLRAALLARGYEVGWTPETEYVLHYTTLTGSGMDRPQ